MGGAYVARGLGLEPRGVGGNSRWLPGDVKLEQAGGRLRRLDLLPLSPSGRPP